MDKKYETLEFWNKFLANLGYQMDYNLWSQTNLYWYRIKKGDEICFNLALQLNTQRNKVDIYLSYMGGVIEGMPLGFFDFRKYTFKDDSEMEEMLLVLKATADYEKIPLLIGIPWAKKFVEVFLGG